MKYLMAAIGLSNCRNNGFSNSTICNLSSHNIIVIVLQWLDLVVQGQIILLKSNTLNRHSTFQMCCSKCPCGKKLHGHSNTLHWFPFVLISSCITAGIFRAFA
ncbi:hypothetical protein CS542_08925 [Pedobacter sp. IW39]|nr:hypothetical protein CS542_08925 [Pedobacter sp. IW39]